VSHLGDRVSALVDGQLGHDERDRLLAHVARCAACHAEVESARALKARLAGLGSPEPSASLTARLHAMAEPGGPMPPVRPRMPGAPGTPVRTATLGPRPGGRADSTAGRSARPGAHRARRLSAVAASFAAGTLTTAFLVGGQPSSSGTPVVPPVDEFAVEHAGTSGDLPLTDPAVAAVPVADSASTVGTASPFGAAGFAARPGATGLGGAGVGVTLPPGSPGADPFVPVSR
jgi:anti-sigma factor RsiW